MFEFLTKLFRRKHPTVRESFSQLKLGGTIFCRDARTLNFAVRVGFIEAFNSDGSIKVRFPSINETHNVISNGHNWVIVDRED